MGILIRLLGIVYSVASKKLASRLIKLGGKEIKSTKSKIKNITDSGVKKLEKKTEIGTKFPGAKKLADTKRVDITKKKAVLGTRGNFSTKDTPGEKVFRKIYNKSKFKGENDLKLISLAGVGVAAATTGLITNENKKRTIKEQIKNATTQKEKEKHRNRMDKLLLKIKQDEVDAAKLKNKKGVTSSLRPTARKFK
mgnify:FL=1